MGQMEAANWYFGAGAGVTFNSGKPVALKNGRVSTPEGCASISTKKGKLLFYTDGASVFDSTHTVMKNGTGLKGWSSCTQNSLIVPWPDSAHLFLVFTTDIWYTPGLKYSVVNMKLYGGKGAIDSSRKNILLTGITDEKLTAIQTSDHRGYWVLTHLFGTDSTLAFLVSNKGVNTSPVISTTGYKACCQPKDAPGYFKVSPDGLKIVRINTGRDTSVISDFNDRTGTLANSKYFRTVKGYGLEFSSSGTYMYTTEFGGQALYQYHLKAPTFQDFLKSKILIDTLNVGWGMQAGPDRKIYISPSESEYLNCITNPDSSGYKCGMVKNSVYLTGPLCKWGLPNFIQNLFLLQDYKMDHSCKDDSTRFKILLANKPDSICFIFGDGGRRVLKNVETGSLISYRYRSPGIYYPAMVIFTPNSQDTISHRFHKFPPVNLGRDTLICNEFSLNLSPSFRAVSHQWSTGAKIRSINVFKAGIYSVKVTDSLGCQSSDTIRVMNPVAQAGILASDTAGCQGAGQFILKSRDHYLNDQPFLSFWYRNGSHISSDSLVQLSLPDTGTYSIVHLIVSKNGCESMDSVHLTIHPNPRARFMINDTAQCLNEQHFEFKNLSEPDTNAMRYDWDLGGLKSTLKDISFKNYRQEGSYTIRLITALPTGCSDTATGHLTVEPSPKADFTWKDPCVSSPVDFRFSGNVPPAPVVSLFIWTFSDGDSSKLKDPQKSFSSTGIYQVRLQVRSSNGCTDDTLQNVTVKGKATANFTAADACENDSVTFVNQSVGASHYKWKFGDGTYSGKENPRHGYRINGKSQTYNVTLVAMLGSGCSDSVISSVTVNENPRPDFKATLSNGIYLEALVSAAKYRWTFWNGDTIFTTGSTLQYPKSPPQGGQVCLMVKNTAGCQGELCKTAYLSGINATVPKVEFSLYPNPGQGTIFLELNPVPEEAIFELLDATGKLIRRQSVDQTMTRLELNIPAGIYTARIRGLHFTASQLLMVR